MTGRTSSTGCAARWETAACSGPFAWWPRDRRQAFVGEGTVKTHINHVFIKLQLCDRAAAVVYAFDHDVVSPSPDRRSE